MAHLRVAVDMQTYGDLTISIGVAFYPSDRETAELLLRRADEALYHSKHAGQNRTSFSEVEPVER